MIKSRKDTDYTDTVVETYRLLADKYSYTARISLIWQLLRDAFLVPEFEILDIRNYNNGIFEAELVDSFIDWKNNRDVDFSKIYKLILETGDFTRAEKLMFEEGNFEERLWAIYLAIDDPQLDLKLNN